jgi:hypothetical protein
VARDLIPPPSPAGRPAPDAPRLVELPPEPGEPGAVAASAPPPGPSPYRHRFGFVLGALAGVLIAAAAVLAVVLTTDGPGGDLAPNWSRWHPDATDATTGATQIADHVQREYHLADGKQLVLVTGGPLEIQSIPLEVAIRPPDGSIQALDGTAVLYTLNGLGPNGSIASGTASKARHLLLRREALELALYSFRYLEDVDMVVALLPPATRAKAKAKGKGSSAVAPATEKQAIFYRPGDLRPQLEVPLGATVPATTPTPERLVGEEARRIDSLTRSNLFLYDFSQGQDAKAYLVLNRPG